MMLHMKRYILCCGAAAAAVGLALSGCRLSDMREFTVRAPAVKNEACAQRVAQALRALDGVDLSKLAFDGPTRTIKVRYEAMKLGQKNIEHAIADAGFDANGIPASAAAKAALPEACR
jgi:copper chaperone CopZ